MEHFNKSSNSLLEYCSSRSNVYIYGTGNLGKAVADYLAFYEISFEGFIISDDQKNIGQLNNHPIYNISYCQSNSNLSVIIATDPKFYNIVVNNTIKNAITDIYFLSFYEQHIAMNLARLQSLGVNLNENVLDYKKFLIANYFKFAKDDPLSLASFAYQGVDLVYPYLEEIRDYSEGPYEYDKVIINKGDVVFDCGAYMGLFTAKAAASGGNVYAFEPTPKICQYLELTQNIYKDNIIIVPSAIADYEGKSNFYLSDWVNSHNSLSNSEAYNEIIEVDITTIDNFVLKNRINKVDFIKADIEGAERLLLKGAKETLKTFSPKLALCTYHRPDDIMILTQLILEANPKYNIIYGWKKLYAWVDK